MSLFRHEGRLNRGLHHSRRQMLALGKAALAAASLTRSAPASAASTVRLGVMPYLPALTLARLFAPLATEAQDILGVGVELKTRKTFASFKKALDDGAFEFVVTHPYLLAELDDPDSYPRFLRIRGELRAAFLTCGEARGLNRIEDLRGRRLALPPRLAGVTYTALHELADAGLAPGRDVKVRFLPNKISTMRAVARGDADACAVPSFLIERAAGGEDFGLAARFVSEPCPNVVLAAHRDVPLERCERLKHGIQRWSVSLAAADAMKAIGWPGFENAADADWVRAQAIVRRVRATEQS